MKTVLITALALALVAAAMLTRPARRDFMLYLLDQRVPPAGSWSAADIEATDKIAHEVTFKNRLLWTTVEKDGKAVYTGVFSHWFPRGQGLEPTGPKASELAQLAKIAKAE